MPSHPQSFPPLLSAVSLLAICAMLPLGGCALNHADRSILADHGVSVPLRQKMAHLAPLTLPEIVELSRDGLLPEYITQYLRASHVMYHITDHDGYWLNRQGVNSTVITYLFATPDLLKRGSDRMAIFDWAPYFTPLYPGSLNTYGHQSYYTEQVRPSAPYAQSVEQAKAELQSDE
jgi:hypothetical protein